MFRLMRRTPSDIRAEITTKWMSLFQDILPAEHYPIIINQHYQVADDNTSKSEKDRLRVDATKPDYRICYGRQVWPRLLMVPKDDGAFKKRYDKEPPMYRALSLIADHLNLLDWGEIGREVYELGCKSKGLPQPQASDPIEMILMLQEGQVDFLVRNANNNREFHILDISGPDVQDELYETNTQYEWKMGFSDTPGFTRYRATNWVQSYGRNPFGLLPEAYSTKTEIESRIRADLDWLFASRYATSIHALFKFATEKMAPYGDKVAIAASHSRFNDAWNEQNWLGVRFKDYKWQNGQYFAQGIDPNMPDEAQILVSLVPQLVAANLAIELKKCIGHTLEGMDVWGIFRQDEKWLFAFSSSNGYDGAVFEIEPIDGSFSFVGLASRFDWELSLEWRTIDSWIQQLRNGFSWSEPDVEFRDLMPKG